MREMAQMFSAPYRQLFLKGEIIALTGQRLFFSGDHALSFSMSEGTGEGLLLGGAFSASCRLSLWNGDGYFSSGASLHGAQIRVELAEEEEWAPLAVFTVQQVTQEEGRLQLSGCDALGVAFEGGVEDDFEYPISLRSLAEKLAARAGFTISGDSGWGETEISRRPEWGDISLRRALAFTAEAAGRFALINRRGELEFRPAWPGEKTASVSPDQIYKWERGGEIFGPLEGLSLSLCGAPRDAEPLQLTLPGSIVSLQNSLAISENPLFSDGAAHTLPLAQALLQSLAGMKLSRCRLSWRGDPAFSLGSRFSVLNSAGEATEMLASSQFLSFSRGFSMQTGSSVPGKGGGIGKLFTSSGALNAAMLSGNINGILVQDGTLAADAIMAGSIAAHHLSAGAVTAEKLSAGAVEADHLSAGALSAFQALIGSAQIDFAQIYDLIADQAIITQGVGGELYIAKLAVTEANMVSLSVGELLLRGPDGGFYALTVDENGNIQTELKLVGNGDVADLSLDGGQKIIAGSITAATLNVKDIFADSAIIREMIAANISVDTLFAREATLSAINALDIRGNQFLRLTVDSLREEMNGLAESAGQQMLLSFSQGNAFEAEKDEIIASVRVMKNGREITSQIPDAAFLWERDSGEAKADAYWNSLPEHRGVKEISLSRADVGKSCLIRCLLDEGRLYGAFEIVNGELHFTPSGQDAFLLKEGALYGPEGYILQDGSILREAASIPMEAESGVFDHSIFESSGIYIRDDELKIRSSGGISMEAGSSLSMEGAEISMKAGSAFRVESGGIAHIDAEDGHVNLGEDFSVTDEGSLVARTGSFADGLRLKGQEVNPGPRIIVSAAEPEETGVLWVKPGSVKSLSFSMETGGARNILWYDGASASQSHAFLLSPESADLMGSGHFSYSLRLPLYEIREARQNIKITVTARKGDLSLAFPEYTLPSIRQWQEVIAEISAESDINLGAGAGDVEIEIRMSGVESNNGLFLQKNDRISLSMVNRSATDSVMPCEVYWKP